MSQILDGKVLGTFIATGGTIATATNESTVGRMKGKKARFLMLTMCNKKSARAGMVMCTYFEEEGITAEQLDMLLKHSHTTDDKGGNIINMAELRASGDLNNDPILNTLFEVEGGVMKTYKFHKGLCYANDKDGVRSKPERLRDSLQVFCQVDTVEMTDAGMTLNYFGGCDPESVGSRLENAFYREPVTITTETPQEDFAQFNGTVQQPVTQPQNPNPQQGAPQNPPQQGYQQSGQQGYQQNGNGAPQQGTGIPI